MENLVEFYKSILEMLNLKVDESGQIYLDHNGIKQPILMDGLPLCLPTDENIRTAVELKDGKPTPVKVLFNPLNEDAIKGENKSFLKLKMIMELHILSVIYQIGETLFGIVKNKDNDITNMEIIKFVATLNNYKAQGVKQIIDDTTLKYWVSLYEKIVSERLDYKYVKFYIKRGGKLNGVKYNRLGVITYPFIENMIKINPKKESFLGVKLRNKDIFAFKSLFEFLFGDLEDIDNNQFGSLNTIAPATHVLLLMYGHVQQSLIPIIHALNEMGVDEDVIEKLNIKPLPIRMETIGDFIDTLKNEIKKVPNENDLVITPPNVVKTVGGTTTTSNEPTSKGNSSFWDRVNPYKNTQQSSQHQQPMIQQSMVQPSMQQPMLQQPMVQQQLDPWAQPDQGYQQQSVGTYPANPMVDPWG